MNGGDSDRRGGGGGGLPRGSDRTGGGGLSGGGDRRGGGRGGLGGGGDSRGGGGGGGEEGGFDRNYYAIQYPNAGHPQPRQTPDLVVSQAWRWRKSEEGADVEAVYQEARRREDRREGNQFEATNSMAKRLNDGERRYSTWRWVFFVCVFFFIDSLRNNFFLM